MHPTNPRRWRPDRPSPCLGRRLGSWSRTNVRQRQKPRLNVSSVTRAFSTPSNRVEQVWETPMVDNPAEAKYVTRRIRFVAWSSQCAWSGSFPSCFRRWFDLDEQNLIRNRQYYLARPRNRLRGIGRGIRPEEPNVGRRPRQLQGYAYERHLQVAVRFHVVGNGLVEKGEPERAVPFP